MKTKSIYNRSACRVEDAEIRPCRRCRGMGGVHGEDAPCSRCNGQGKHWQTAGGWVKHLYSRKDGFLI
jgi:methylphosphotriester-DNA--protein-cysteine methyltransferase